MRMTHLQEMLRQKEMDLSRLQKEVEALRLVVELVAEGHSKVAESGDDLRKSAAPVAAVASPDISIRNVPVAPAVMSTPATVTNGGAKRFP